MVRSGNPSGISMIATSIGDSVDISLTASACLNMFPIAVKRDRRNFAAIATLREEQERRPVGTPLSRKLYTTVWIRDLLVCGAVPHAGVLRRGRSSNLPRIRVVID